MIIFIFLINKYIKVIRITNKITVYRQTICIFIFLEYLQSNNWLKIDGKDKKKIQLFIGKKPKIQNFHLKLPNCISIDFKIIFIWQNVFNFFDSRFLLIIIWLADVYFKKLFGKYMEYNYHYNKWKEFN